MGKYSKELVKQACELYINSDNGIQDQAKELHISRSTYRKLLNENFDFVTISSREDAWKLYKTVTDRTKFFRYINQAERTGLTFLLHVVVSDKELKDLIEVKGISTKKINELVNMPFVTTNFIHDYAGRRGFKYSKEAINRNRLEGLKDTYAKDGAIEEINNKRRKTMTKRYGADNPMRVENIKKKQRDTTLDRFGVPVSTMNKDVQKKQQETSLKK